jgi:hypothetical protein
LIRDITSEVPSERSVEVNNWIEKLKNNSQEIEVGSPLSAGISNLIREKRGIVDEASKAISLTQARIEGINRDITNMFLIIRSFCLGALGGFAILMANYAFNDSGLSIISRDRFGRSLASMLMGGIVAILAFGLFYTKQISVFHIQEAESGTTLPAPPDFWQHYRDNWVSNPREQAGNEAVQAT